MLLLFFFQAEDGIRDTSVTGVQTCALPISGTFSQTAPLYEKVPVERRDVVVTVISQGLIRPVLLFSVKSKRSEERRVGKECRCRGTPEVYRKVESKRKECGYDYLLQRAQHQ